MSNRKALVLSDVQPVVQFITNYADTNALVLPGRIPGYKKGDIKLLPSSHTKKLVYDTYKASVKNQEQRIVGSSSFFTLWKQLTPFVVAAKPMTDLCWTCQKNNIFIYRLDLRNKVLCD